MLTQLKPSLTYTRIKNSLRACQSWLLIAPLVAAAAVLALAADHRHGPPSADIVHTQLPALHGQVLSVKYIEPLNSYRVRLLSPLGQTLSFEQEARSGRLLGLQTQPDSALQLPQGLLTLDTMLHQFFGEADFQLLAAELNLAEPQANYALDWIQEGASFHAHFDARSGSLLAQPQA